MIEDNGRLNYYLDKFSSPLGGTLWFLTSQTDSEGRPLAEVKYSTGGPCSGVSDSGVPYVTTVYAPGMSMGFRFNYVDLAVPGSSQRDCVISSVDLMQPDGGVGGTARYTYRNGQSGYLAGVDGGALVEAYNYDGGFGRHHSGTQVSFNPLDGNNHATADYSAGPQFTLDGGYYSGFCDSNTCCVANGNLFSRTLTYLNENVGDGTGNTSDPGFKTQFKVAPVHPEASHAEQVMARTDGCPSSANSCSEGDEYYAWLSASNNGTGCANATFSGFKNKLGNWFFSHHFFAVPDAGPFAGGQCTTGATCAWEISQTFSGVSPNINSGNALQSYTSSYGYSTATSVKHRTRIETNSVLETGAKAGTFYKYTSDTNRLEAVFQYGYTRTPAGGSTPVSRTIGTFYRTARTCDSTGDGHGRVVAIEGPCIVSGTSAIGCAADGGTSATGPTTQLFYYADNTNNNNAGRLHHVDQYPNGCSSTPNGTWIAPHAGHTIAEARIGA